MTGQLERAKSKYLLLEAGKNGFTSADAALVKRVLELSGLEIGFVMVLGGLHSSRRPRLMLAISWCWARVEFLLYRIPTIALALFFLAVGSSGPMARSLCCTPHATRYGSLSRDFERFNERRDRGPRDGAENLFLGLKVEVEGRF